MTSRPPLPISAGHDGYGRPGPPEWLGVDWREHQRWVAVGGGAVNVVEYGAGPGGDTIVMVHGVDGCWTDWLENICVLGRAHRVIALDLPGFGWSQAPRDDVSIPGCARTVDAVCAALDLGPVAYAGHSLGGFVGAELALSFPERVERLVLCAPAILFAQDHPRRRRTLALGAALERWAGVTAGRFELFHSHPRARRLALGGALHWPERLRPEITYEMMKPRADSPQALRAALRALFAHDVFSRLAEIRCPALVVWGADDTLLPVANAAVIAAALPEGRLEVFAETGHCPQVERPARFNALVDEFLGGRTP